MIKYVAYVFKAIAWLISHLPISVQFFMGDFIGILWFDILRIRRSVALENLKLAFPDKDRSQLIKIARKSVCNLGRGFVEFCHFPFIKDNRKYLNKFIIEGREHLEEALKKNCGVCLLTLHLGNGDFATAGLAIHGIRFHLISKEFKLKWLNHLWFSMRSDLGTQFIAPRNSAYSILKALKKNEVVVFVQDQFMGPPIGIQTTFFGHTTGTALGLSVMASRYNSPIVPVYNYRRYDGKIVIIFKSEMVLEEQNEGDEKLKYITQKCNDQLQEFVEEHPEQWMWVHRRWKKGQFKVD